MHNSELKVKRYALESYGCQMNMADSELVDGILKDIGLKKTENLSWGPLDPDHFGESSLKRKRG